MKTFSEMMRLVAPRLGSVEALAPLSFEELSAWFGYYFKRGTCVVLTDKEFRECKAVAVMKLFSRLEQFLEEYVHEPSGKYVEVVAANFGEPKTMQMCLDAFKARWGPQETVLWDRGKKTERCPRIYRWEQYERLVRKFSYGIS